MENELENLETQESSPAKPRRRKASSAGFKAQPSPTVEETAQPESSPEPEPAPVEITPDPEPAPTPPAPVAVPTPEAAPVVSPTKRQRHDRIRKPLKLNKGDNNNGLRIRY